MQRVPDHAGSKSSSASLTDTSTRSNSRDGEGSRARRSPEGQRQSPFLNSSRRTFEYDAQARRCRERGAPMADGNASDGRALAAGDFASWVAQMQGAIRGENGSDVPCGGCTACCTSSQFVHIEPDETDTLSHIPQELQFPAPGLPHGHVLLGYDGRGHCPMPVDNHCSIYEHRPRTCRTYDCRVFPAAGVGIDDDDQTLIDRQARRWEFSFPTPAERTQLDAVRAAATFLQEHTDVFPSGTAPATATQLAVLAIELHHFFLRRDEETHRPTVVTPDPEQVKVELRRRMGGRESSARRAPR